MSEMCEETATPICGLKRARARLLTCVPIRPLIIWLAVLTGAPLHASTPPLVLVSIDGFRHDYLDIHDAPHLNALAKAGVRVERLKPIYPPNTFPGHLSLITGVAPADHGIVDNTFCHRSRGDCYTMGMGGKDATWLKAVPLWNWVKAQGFKAATYFWPESDALWGGEQPDYFFPYDKSVPYDERVNQVLDWLALPESERPRLITLYFSGVDSAGHRYGPLAPQTAKAVAKVDGHIGDLLKGIERLGSSVNVLVVSDHGMAEISGAHAITASELPEPKGYKRMVSHSRVRYYATNTASAQDVSELLALLDARSQGRWQTLTASEALSLGGADEQTVADITLVTRPPSSFVRRSMSARAVEGSHGYLLSEPEMDAFAVAYGPAFGAGAVVAEAHQLDVFPLATAVMGLATPPGLPSNGGALLGALRSHSH